MGTSHPETKPWSASRIKSVKPATILDVGAGSGSWIYWLKRSGVRAKVDALEVWEPYISKYRLHNLYNRVIEADVRDWDDFNYDVVILGDVLEHMSKDEAVAVMERVAKQAKYALIAIPIIHYEQGSLNGNPYEVHVKDDWTHEEVLETFPNITSHATFSMTAAYWLCYNS